MAVTGRRRRFRLVAKGRRTGGSPVPERRTGDLATAILILVGLAALFLSYSNYGVNVLDEGYLLGAVERVARGEVPYRDFAHQYAPGRFYLFSWLFELVPPSIEATRAVWALLLALTGTAIYLTARHFAGRVAALWPVLAFAVAPGPWQKSFLVLGSIVLALALLRFCEKPAGSRAFLFGVLAGAVLILRQDVALYGMVAFAVAVVRLAPSRWAHAGSWLLLAGGGFALAVAPVAAAFFMKGALGDAVWSMLFAGLEGVRANALPFPSLLPLMPRSLGDLIEVPSRLLHYLPPLVLGIAAIWGLLIRERSRSAGVLSLAALGVLLFRLDLDRSHAMHLLQVLPIPWIFTAAALERWGGTRAKSATAVAVIALVILSKIGHSHYPSSFWVRAGMSKALELDRAHLRLEPNRAAALSGVVRYVREQTEKNEPLLALPDLPLVHFLSDRPNPLRYDLLRAGRLHGADDERETIRRIDTAAPTWFVWNTKAVDSELPGRRLQAHAPALWGHLMGRFRLVEEFGPYRVYRRRDEKPPRPEIVLLGVEGWTVQSSPEPPPGLRDRCTQFDLALSPSMNAEEAWLAMSSGVTPGRRRQGIEGGFNLRSVLSSAGYRLRGWDEAVDLRDHAAKMAVVDRIVAEGFDDAYGLLERAFSEREGERITIVAGLGKEKVLGREYERAAGKVRGVVAGARPTGTVFRSDLTRVPFDSAVRVPLWVASPTEGVRRSPAPVSLLDVVPTLLDLLALDTGERVDGVSLVPITRGFKAISRYHYVEGSFRRADDPRWWGIRGRAWKLLLGPSGERVLLDLSADPGETLDLSVRSRERVRRLTAIAISSVEE
ncbi:MAG: hypothetical protein CME06_03525 [Gemmatimonadetes bacterium]|nr:hypothetical protein [Gemmatimonadota bacterium]